MALAGHLSGAHGALKELGRQLEQQTDRKADDIGDTALHPRYQGRAQGLDGVAAGAALPLAEVDITLHLGWIEVLEDDLGAFEPTALPTVGADHDEAAHHRVSPS